MNLTGTEVRVGMTAAANVSSVNATGSVTIGTPVAALVYTDAPTVAYSLRMDIASGETLTLDMATGLVTGADPGVLQVETATVIAAAGATTAGDATVIVTAANLAGSPLTVSVPLLLTDNTAALVATKIRAALTANAAIASIFTVGGTVADIVLTAKIGMANDETLNISIANGTCAGITAAPTSLNTTAGVLKTQAYRISGTTWDQTDFEGELLPSMSACHALLIKSLDSSVDTVFFNSVASNDSAQISEGSSVLFFSKSGALAFGGESVTFLADGGNAFVTIDIHAG